MFGSVNLCASLSLVETPRLAHVLPCPFWAPTGFSLFSCFSSSSFPAFFFSCKQLNFVPFLCWQQERTCLSRQLSSLQRSQQSRSCALAETQTRSQVATCSTCCRAAIETSEEGGELWDTLSTLIWYRVYKLEQDSKLQLNCKIPCRLVLSMFTQLPRTHMPAPV